MRTLVVIPARLAAFRLPHKPLRSLGGAPLIVRVWERVAAMRCVDRVVVATDAQEVIAAVISAGGEAVLTHSTHASGTERVAEVATMPNFREYSTIVNVQGDEPFISETCVGRTAALVAEGRFAIGTAAAPAPAEVAGIPSVVKVVVADDGRAMYFSRAPIPFARDTSDGHSPEVLQHLGVYAYTRAALSQWVALPPHPLELIERLEQLRPLAAGIPIGVAVMQETAEIGIDTEEDLHRANARWNDLHPVESHAK